MTGSIYQASRTLCAGAGPLTDAQAVLTHFDRPCSTSSGPTEAINGRLEHLRGIALGFRGLTRYIIRSLVHTGCLKDRLKQPPQLHDRPIYTPSNTKNQFKCLDIA